MSEKLTDPFFAYVINNSYFCIGILYKVKIWQEGGRTNSNLYL